MADSSNQNTSDSKSNYFSGETRRVFSLHQVKCPECGGAADIASGQEQVTCQFCGNQFEVDMADPDFVIDHGVLTKYRGESREAVVPDHVRSIGPAAFNMQDSLTKIVLPEGVVELQGSNNFRGCRSLETLVLPEGLEAIPDCAFAGCERLRKIVLPRNLKSLGRMVFDGCKSLVSVAIPPGVSIVEKDAFSNCANLETIVLGENTELRGMLLAESCPKLSTIIVLDAYFGEKVAEKRTALDIIGYYTETTVWQMGGEERAALARRVTESKQQQPQVAPAAAPESRPSEEVVLESGASKLSCTSCNGVINITEDQAQATCPFCGQTYTVSFESPEFVIDQGILVKYAGENREVTVPEGVRAIGLLAFYGQSSVTKIVMPDSVTELQGTFMGCRSLETLVLSNNIESVPDVAFQDCASLKTITLPRNLRFVGNMAFGNCSSLTTIEIPPQVKFLEKMAFYNCASLETIIRHESTKLSGDFFVMCPKLSTLIILDDVTGEKIEERRFELNERGSHSEVTVWSIGNREKRDAGGAPGNAAAAVAAAVASAEANESQPDYAAAAPTDPYGNEPEQHLWPRDIRCTGCGAVIQLTNAQPLVNCEYCGSQFSINVDNPDFIIDEGVLVKYIGMSREVLVPDAARVVGTLAFYQQSSLKKIVLPNSVTELAGAFAGCFDLETLVLSDNIRTIPAGAFKDCVSLTKVVLPANLRTIESLAFVNCKSLTSVELPEPVASLDFAVFHGCESLETVACYKGLKLREEVFVDCPKLSTLVTLSPGTGEKLSEQRMPWLGKQRQWGLFKR